MITEKMSKISNIDTYHMDCDFGKIDSMSDNVDLESNQVNNFVRKICRFI